MSQKMACWVGAQGQVKLGQNGKNMPLLWHHPQKKTNPKTKIFSIWTRRLAESVEGLNSSLAQLAGKKWCCKALPKQWHSQDLKGKPPSTGGYCCRESTQ